MAIGKSISQTRHEHVLRWKSHEGHAGEHLLPMEIRCQMEAGANSRYAMTNSVTPDVGKVSRPSRWLRPQALDVRLYIMGEGVFVSICFLLVGRTCLPNSLPL